MLTVHHLNHSRSQRVLWLLEELELPYAITFYERDPVTRLAPPALRAIHPLGKSPVLVDGAKTVAETGAIVEYLIEKTGGRLRPEAGTPEKLRWTYWMHFAEGSLMPQLLLDLVLTSAPGRAPEALREAAKAVADGARPRSRPKRREPKPKGEQIGVEESVAEIPLSRADHAIKSQI